MFHRSWNEVQLFLFRFNCQDSCPDGRVGVGYELGEVYGFDFWYRLFVRMIDGVQARSVWHMICA